LICFYQVADAVRLCASFLNSSITLENCVDILYISELYSLETCSVLARSFVLANFESLADQHSDEFMKLSASQLTSLLSDNALCVASEYRLFDLILGWVRHDLRAREQHISQLMFHIRLPLCTGEELVEKVSREPLVTTNSSCYRLLVEAKDYHIVVYKQPLLQNARTQVRLHYYNWSRNINVNVKLLRITRYNDHVMRRRSYSRGLHNRKTYVNVNVNYVNV